MNDIEFKKVKTLNKELREKLIARGFKDNDTVTVKTSIEKIEGSPIMYLQGKLKKRPQCESPCGFTTPEIAKTRGRTCRILRPLQYHKMGE